MSIFSEEQVLKVLNMYNPWWKTDKVPEDFIKPIKRVGYYETKKIIESTTIRRFAILSGARRVGKTTILYQLIESLLMNKVQSKNIIYISLDNPILKFGTLDKILEIYINTYAPIGKIYIFLDEIQYAKDWNNWLKIFYDQNKEWQIIATGSASPLIEKGVSESGTGRWTTITIPTLSFYEYYNLIKEKTTITEEAIKKILEYTQKMDEKYKNEIYKRIEQVRETNNIDDKIPKDFSIANIEKMDEKDLIQIVNMLEPIQKYFSRYLTLGGFPELALSDEDKYAQRILREDIVDKVLKRDLPELFGIRNISILEKLFLYICFESSNIINYTSMNRELEGVTIPTLMDYIKYLENANLIYISEPTDKAIGKSLNSRPKIYVVDSAIRNAVLMKDDILTDSVEMGYVVETAVYRHVYTYIKNSTGTIGYYRDKKGDKEIDIVTNSVKENMYIEVKYKEKPIINKDNPIYEMTKQQDRIFVITKNISDVEIKELEKGKKMVKIPAFAFLYLIGLEEVRKLEN